MENFTPIASTVGGLLIGLAASLMLLLHGRIAGISGIVGGLLKPRAGDMSWRLLFVSGLIAGGLAFAFNRPEVVADDLDRSLVAIAAAGLLVGVGTRMGSGCTSGHGVCGLSRFSVRSAVAVATFMTTGIITVWFSQQVLRGEL